MSGRVECAPARPLPRNLTLTVSAFVAGSAMGIVGGQSGWAWVAQGAAVLEPAGQAWTGALRVVVVPLVVCLLLCALGGRGSEREAGRAGVLAGAFFVVSLTVVGVLTVFLSPVVIGLLGVTPGAMAGTVGDPRAAALDVSGGAASAGWWDLLADGNVMGAVGRAGLMGVIVLTLILAVALGRTPERQREAALSVIGAALQVCYVMLGWLLWVAPLGVFALAVVMGLKTGWTGPVTFIGFVTTCIVLLVVYTGLLYPVAAVAGGVSVRRFAAAAAPAQAVALGTRSSIASLGAIVEGGRRLGVPESVNALVPALAVGMYKLNRTASGTVKLMFLSHVYGIEVTPGTIVAYVASLVVLSFASPGTPGGGAHASTPALLAAGMPIEGIALAQAVDDVPDVFKTVLNVTADLAATVFVGRWVGREEVHHGVSQSCTE